MCEIKIGRLVFIKSSMVYLCSLRDVGMLLLICFLFLYDEIHSNITGIIIALVINSKTAVLLSSLYKNELYLLSITVQLNPKIMANLKEIAIKVLSEILLSKCKFFLKCDIFVLKVKK